MENILSPEVWQTIYTSIAKWVISTLPSVVLILLLILISIKLLNYSLKKFRLRQKRQAEKEGKTANQELEKRQDTLLGILRGVGKLVIWIIGLMVLLNNVGVDVGPLIAGAGILGLAVGFGAQELVRDFISGFFLLLENQVRSGDVAIINGTGGLVEKISLRTITLRDLSGIVHVFQNGKISTLSNMTKTWSAMVFDIGIAYKENTDEATKIIKQVGEGLAQDEAFKDALIDPLEVFGVDSFGDSAVVIKARFKTKPGQQWNVGREFRRRLKYAFDKENIEIPFPHRTIYWGEEIKPLELQMQEGQKSA